MNQAAEWLTRWQRGQTGFHQLSVDRHLRTHWPSLGLPPGTRVLVPMCGKSLDLVWLTEAGCRVVGIDISPIAIEALLLESGIAARRSSHSGIQSFETPVITAISGDFFDIGKLGLGLFPAVYDRAAFTAMAPEYRDAYVNALLEMTCVGSRIMMTVLQYQPIRAPGPPFSIAHEELEQRFARWFSVRTLSRVDKLASDTRMRSRGVTSLHETCCLLERLH